MDYFLLVGSLVPIGMLLLSGRGSIHEFGPFALYAFGAAWHFWWKWRKDRWCHGNPEIDFVPCPPYDLMTALIGFFVCVVVAAVWFFATPTFLPNR